MVSCVYVYMCLFHDLCVSVHCGHSNRMPFSENLWWVLCFILKQNAIEMYLHEVSTLHRAHIRLTEEWELYASKLFFRWTYLRSWVVDSSARPQSHDVAHFCFRSFICFFSLSFIFVFVSFDFMWWAENLNVRKTFSNRLSIKHATIDSDLPHRGLISYYKNKQRKKNSQRKADACLFRFGAVANAFIKQTPHSTESTWLSQISWWRKMSMLWFFSLFQFRSKE